MHARHVSEVVAAQQDESHLGPDLFPTNPARETSSNGPVLPSAPQPRPPADAALAPAAGQTPSSEPPAAVDAPSRPAAAQPPADAAQAPAAGEPLSSEPAAATDAPSRPAAAQPPADAAQAPAAGEPLSSEPAAATDAPSRPAAAQPHASQAPAAGVVAEGMRSAAPGCTEVVPPSTEAASAAANSATRLPLSASASLADDLPLFRVVDDHPFYFCSPRGCFVAFPPGQVGTCPVPIPRARAQRAERPVSIHAHALPTVSPSPRRPTGSGTVNVTFSVKGQVRMTPSCDCAVLSPSGLPMPGL